MIAASLHSKSKHVRKAVVYFRSEQSSGRYYHFFHPLTDLTPVRGKAQISVVGGTEEGYQKCNLVMLVTD